MNPALIFDLDGTLVDTAPDLLGALNAILIREGRPPVNHADLRHLVGFGARTMMIEAFKMTGGPMDEARLPALIDDYIAHYRKHIAVASRPFPGVEDTLAALKADGIRMGVLTNKPQELTDLLLPALDLAKYFTAIHGAGRYSYNKPDARVFHHVVDELGGGAALMIGDSATDVATARAAKAPVILVSFGYTPEPASALGGDIVVDHFADIPAAAETIARRMTDHAPILKAEFIVKTVERLAARITERFPESGLANVAADLAETARKTAARVDELSKPNYLLRGLALVAIAAGLFAQIFFAEIIDWSNVLHRADPVGLTQSLDAIVNLLILAFGAIWFVLTLEQRLKRRRILARLYELRAFAHVIDMHQLTKDPTVVLSESKPTESSPERRMTEFELSRYLDYCAEMLALIAKLAALYGERTRDRDVMVAVTEIEEVTSDLGRKIWQKIMILSDLDERHSERPR